ncbi:MAG: radical SAM protein [Elusimicrobia bacterium]|nr:radical SAM protein [Elusimicrobiota bacterium]
MPSDRKPFNLDLVVTRACPMACGYCRMDRRGGAMPKGVWKRGVELLLREEGPLELQFLGGEPLVEYDLLRDISAFAASRALKAGKPLSRLVTTNGLLLTPARSRELAEEGCGVMLSIDGGREVQAAQRPMAGAGSWAVLRRNMAGLLGSGARFFVNLVVTPESAGRLAGGAAFLIKEGVRSLQIAYALGVIWSEESLRTLERQLRVVSLLAEDARPKVDLYNRRNEAEPVLLSPQHLVDSDGTLFVGVAIVLEELWPGLQRAFRVGDVRRIERFPGRRMTQADQLRRLRSAKLDPAGRGIMLNNLAAGYRIRKFWEGERGRQSLPR